METASRNLRGGIESVARGSALFLVGAGQITVGFSMVVAIAIEKLITGLWQRATA